MKEEKKQQVYSEIEQALRSCVGYSGRGVKSEITKFCVYVDYAMDKHQTNHDDMVNSALDKVKQLLEDPRNSQLRSEAWQEFCKLYKSLNHIENHPYRINKRGGGFKWIKEIKSDERTYEEFYGIKSHVVLEAYDTLKDNIALLSTDSLVFIGKAAALTGTVAAIFGAGYWAGKEKSQQDVPFAERAKQEQVEPVQGR